MRHYRIRYVRHGTTTGEWRYDVIAVSLDNPDVDDVINSFATVAEAQAYIVELDTRNSRLGGG